MRELGHILQSARESQGVSLDVIEEQTKIRKRYLIALEEGDWGALPGRVYARGFVRSYAEVLGLDGAELLQRYVDGKELESNERTPAEPVATKTGQETIRVPRVTKAGSPSKSDASQTPRKAVAKMAEPRSLNEMQRQRASVPKPEERPISDVRKVRKGVGGAVGQWMIIVAALIVVGGGLWFLHGRHVFKSAAPAKPPTSTMTTPGLDNNTASQAAVPSSNAAGSVANATNNGSTANGVGAGSAAPVQTITQQPLQNGGVTYVVHNAADLRVTLKVIQGQCWISASADATTVDGNDTVNPGQTRHFKGKHSVVIRLGHVQGVELLVNGQMLTLPNTQTAINVTIQR